MTDLTQPRFEEMVDFFKSGRRRSYKKGEIILRPGDIHQGIYFIEEGFIKVFGYSKDGIQHDHIFYQPGDLFPLMWVFRDITRSVYYEAMTPAVLRLKPKDEFIDFIKLNNTVLFKLVEYATALFFSYADRIDNLLYSNSLEKVAYRFLSLASGYGKEQAGKIVIDVPITHKDLANSVSISRETATRTIGRLQRKGILSVNSNHLFVINDLKGLIKIIGIDTVESMWKNLVSPSK